MTRMQMAHDGGVRILEYDTNSKGIIIIYVIYLNKVSKTSALLNISILITYVLGLAYLILANG